MAQVRKDQLSKRHSIAVDCVHNDPCGDTIGVLEEEDMAAGETSSSNRRQRKKPVAKNTVSQPPVANSSKRQRSISLIHNRRKVSAEGSLTTLKEDSEVRKEVDRKLSEIEK